MHKMYKLNIQIIKCINHCSVKICLSKKKLTTHSSNLLENFEDSFEKKVDGLELSAEVSCDEVGIPA